MLILLLFALVTGKIKVYNPEPLRKQIEDTHRGGFIHSSLANFGNPPYGTSMMGTLYAPMDEEISACAPLSPFDVKDYEWYDSNPILLVERGNCPFVRKVHNAEARGVKAVIVIDNKDEDTESIIMSDNGAGGNISIPSFLISKNSGGILLKAVKENPKEPIILKLAFEMDK